MFSELSLSFAHELSLNRDRHSQQRVQLCIPWCRLRDTKDHEVGVKYTEYNFNWRRNHPSKKFTLRWALLDVSKKKKKWEHGILIRLHEQIKRVD